MAIEDTIERVARARIAKFAADSGVDGDCNMDFLLPMSKHHVRETLSHLRPGDALGNGLIAGVTTLSTDDLIAAVVRFVVSWDEVYERDGNPLTPDHVFGDYVMRMREPRKLLENSDRHLEQRIRAITASAIKSIKE